MEPFEYVVVLTSLILGLGIAQILIGVSDSISNYDNVKFGVPHSLLILITFMALIQEWWIDYQYSKIIEIWTLPIVMSLIIFPIILFFTATVLFPPGRYQGEKSDLDKYYFERWPVFFMAGLIGVLVSMWQNVYIQNIPLTNQGPQWGYVLTYIVFLVFKIRNRIVHTIYLSLQLAVWIGYIATYRTVL